MADPWLSRLLPARAGAFHLFLFLLPCPLPLGSPSGLRVTYYQGLGASERGRLNPVLKPSPRLQGFLAYIFLSESKWVKHRTFTHETGVRVLNLVFLDFILRGFFCLICSLVSFRQQKYLVRLKQHNYSVRVRQQNYLVRFRVRVSFLDFLIAFCQKALKANFSHVPNCVGLILMTLSGEKSLWAGIDLLHLKAEF